MNVQSIARWQWLVLSVLLGLVVGGVRRWSAHGLPASGECITLQQTFDQRLLTRIGGQPLFKDVFVSRQALDDGSGRRETVDIVRGKSCDGTVQADGKYHWEPAYYIARVPYHPVTDWSELAAAGETDPTARWAQIERPGVRDFLLLAHARGGPSFTNAWWDTHPMASALAASVLVVGLAWPCLIDLIVHGRLVRPRQPKTRLPPAKTPLPNADDAASAPTVDGVPAALDVADSAQPCHRAPSEVKELAGLTDEANTPVASDEDGPKHFGARPEDYYPTELRASDA